MEIWILLAAAAAIISSATNLFIKDIGTKIDEYAAGFIRNLLILPFMWGMLLFTGFPHIDPTFWKLIVVMLPFEFFLVIFYQKAFKLSPVSLLVPILSLSPIFIAVVSFFLFDEKLTFYHLIALIAFVVGVYFLNLKASDKHILSPIVSLFKDKGPFYILIVAVILGVTVSLGKQAIVASSPQFFSAIYYSFVTIMLFPLYKVKSKIGINDFLKYKKPLILLGIFNPLGLFLVFSSFKTGPTAVVQAISSSSILFSVLFAGTFLKEKGIKKRIIASLFILSGTLLLVFK